MLKDIWPLFVNVKNFRDEYMLLIHFEGDLKSHTTLRLIALKKTGCRTKNSSIFYFISVVSYLIAIVNLLMVIVGVLGIS